AGGNPYCIVIPPPNVTGALHLGHAINNTLQDILIRYHRMCGDNTLWLPGVDHAGIATQAVVEKKLFEEEGKTRHDIGREALVQRIWDWKQKFGDRIVVQLQAMGCSCDWSRLRFTLDAQCARAVRHTFFKLFRDGLIYRGKRLVNWDTVLQTAVSDDEVYHETIKGNLWYIWYPVQGGDTRVLVATTRPETMLGDTAVAVHPDDPRYQHLIGKTVLLPLMQREIPIVADAELVDPAFGTGCVKVTPAHDPNDYACAQRRQLPLLNILNPDGTINDHGGRFAGLDRYAARKAVVAELEALGLLEKIEPHETPVGHSDRSKSPIEPYLSDQWFLTMTDLAETAMAAVSDGRVAFHPPRYAKMYLDWLSEKRDWPISRQLWWGHRIPIWYAADVDEAALRTAFAGRDDVAWRWDEDHQQWWLCARDHDLAPDAVPGCVLQQDPDVLDTWFSSALWPHSTLGWPDATPDLQTWYPTNVLVTSRDIVTLWVARMVMTGLYNLGRVPFSDVVIHVKILDGQGQTMSKSKGNGVDPIDIIEQYGADALRFVMAYTATETQDVRMPVQYKCPHCGTLTPQTPKNMTALTLPCAQCKKSMATRWADEPAQQQHGLALLTSERFELGRNFCNKIWNASRFALMYLEPGVPIFTPEQLQQAIADGRCCALSADDTWILERLALATELATTAIEQYRYHDYAAGLYEFIWNEVCDWYLEAAKSALHGEPSPTRRRAQTVLAGVLGAMVRLLQPVMPFIAEEIWRVLHEVCGAAAPGLLALVPWPRAVRGFCSPQRLQLVNDKYELIRLGRSLRGEFSIAPAAKVRFAIRPHDEASAIFLREQCATLQRFLGAAEIMVDPAFVPPHPLPTQVSADATLYMFLDGVLDVAAETARITRQRAETEKFIAGIAAKLANEKFVAHAAPEVVEAKREKLREARERLGKLEQMQAMLRV
ncbi:MAG: valine--tRNA ligase, partial [bacterium]|nr:valine--tRNA ligase [bacterium]